MKESQLEKDVLPTSGGSDPKQEQESNTRRFRRPKHTRTLVIMNPCRGGSRSGTPVIAVLASSG